jgi:hypothetical protein
LEELQLLVGCRRSDSISPLPGCSLRIAGKLWMTFRILSYHDNGERRELTLEGWTVALDRTRSNSKWGRSTLLQEGAESQALIYKTYNAER